MHIVGRKVLFFYFLIGYCIPLISEEPSTKKEKYFYKIINDNSQKTYIEKPVDGECCQDRTNSDLVECVFALPIKDQKEVFKEFTPAKRREYLRNLSCEHYEKFLKAYNEHDWKNLYNALSKEEQKYWPKTLKQQIIALQRMKDFVEDAGDATALSITACGAFISPYLLALHGYTFFYLFTENKNPIKEKCKIWCFKRFMETNFQI